MIKALKSFRRGLAIDFVLKANTKQVDLINKIFDIEGEVSKLDSSIMESEFKLEQLKDRISSERDPERASELKEEKLKLEAKIAEERKSLKKLQKKLGVLRKVGDICEKIDDARLKKMQKETDRIREENEKDRALTNFYLSKFGVQPMTVTTKDSKIDEISDEILRMMDERNEPTIDEMYDQIIKLYGISKEEEEKFKRTQGRDRSVDEMEKDGIIRSPQNTVSEPTAKQTGSSPVEQKKPVEIVSESEQEGGFGFGG